MKLTIDKAFIDKILALKAEGKSRPEVAKCMGVSVSHINRIYKEHGIKSTPEEAKLARSLASQARAKDCAFIEKQRAAQRAAYARSEVKERQAEGLRKAWAGGYGDKLRAKMQSDEYRQKQAEVSPRLSISSRVKSQFSDPEFRAEFDSRMADPKYRESAKLKSIDNWQSDEYRQKTLAALERARPAISVSSKALWENPEYRAKIEAYWADQAFIKEMEDYWRSDDFRALVSAGVKSKWLDEKYRDAQLKALAARAPGISAIAKALWQDPIFREKMAAAQSRPDYLKHMSESTRALWADPAYRERMYKSTWADPAYRERMYKSTWADPAYRERMAVARQNTPTTMTKPHRAVCAGLEVRGLKYTCEYAIGPWNFDIYVDTHKTLIEVQGEYWHSRSEQQARDKAKLTYINEYRPDLKLKYIPEVVAYSPVGLAHALDTWFGLAPSQVTFDFAQVSVRQVSSATGSEFLNLHHYQNAGGAGKYTFGAYLGDRLIAAARYSHPTRQGVAESADLPPETTLELTRFCIHPNHQKKNFATWLMARCERELRLLGVTHLVTFADTTFGHTGAIYKAGNWTHVGETAPNYWYINADGWVLHKKTIYSQAVKMKMAEADYAAKHNLRQTWGKEKLKFVKKL